MRRRSPLSALAASPTMVGAVTTLIVIVAVFLAYNANQGLPFVPVYRVSVDVPNAARLGTSNEVRIGGTRVGIVEEIKPVTDGSRTQTALADGEGGPEVAPVAARVTLKLDESAGPLPVDSIFRIRYRSAFGLKYLEIIRGQGEPAPENHVFDGTDDEGGCALPTDPENFTQSLPEQARNGCFQPQTEFDAIANTFDTETRENARRNLEGYGNAFAARGTSLNDAIASLRPLLRDLGPVAETLADPDTQLRRFFAALGRTASIVAPVSTEQVEFITDAATTFAALSANPERLKESISEGPETLRTASDTLPRQRPFLSEFAELSERLRPGAQELRVALPTLNSAIDVGTPVLARTPALNRELRGALVELRRLVDQPSTGVALNRLVDTLETGRRLTEWVVPAQTVCNYFNYWFTFLPEALSDRDQVGYNFRQTLVNAPLGPIGVHIGPETIEIPGEAQGPVGGYSGIQANGRSAINGMFNPHHLPILHANPYAPTGQDGSDCQPGQTGYIKQELRVPGQPVSNPSVVVPDIPGSRGPTTLYWNNDGTREWRDTRVEARQP